MFRVVRVDSQIQKPGEVKINKRRTVALYHVPGTFPAQIIEKFRDFQMILPNYLPTVHDFSNTDHILFIQ